MEDIILFIMQVTNFFSHIYFFLLLLLGQVLY